MPPLLTTTWSHKSLRHQPWTVEKTTTFQRYGSGIRYKMMAFAFKRLQKRLQEPHGNHLKKHSCPRNQSGIRCCFQAWHGQHAQQIGAWVCHVSQNFPKLVTQPHPRFILEQSLWSTGSRYSTKLLNHNRFHPATSPPPYAEPNHQIGDVPRRSLLFAPKSVSLCWPRHLNINFFVFF